MDLSLNWKANDDTNLSKNRLAQNLDQPEEEEPFYADGDQLGEICFQFVQNPYPNLRNLYEISDILVESSSSLIKYLREIKFFQTFGNFINSVTDPNDRIAVLQILLNLSRLPTDVCLDLIEGNDLALKFLKAQIFSTIDEIRYLSLKCLKHFAQDSHLCRFVILFNNLVFDLYSALIGNKNDMKTISLIEKIFTYLLLEDFSDNDFINFSQQIAVTSQLNHPSIKKFHGFIPVNFKSGLNHLILTEVTFGNLKFIREKNLKNIQQWDDTQKLINIYGIACGMSYLHSHNILHRDLKIENIYIDDLFFPKISGFHLSKEIQSNSDKEIFSQIQGTPAFLSPEIQPDKLQ